MPESRRRPARALSAIGCATLGASLGWMALSRSARESDLARSVSEASTARGLEHEVTAVLLDFRGYDTLLETAVLLAALTGVWAVHGTLEASRGESPRARGTRETIDDPSGLVDGLLRVLAPILLVASAYLGWAGSHAPGGAFQAGTVLASLLILLTLAHPIDPGAALSRGARALSSAGLWVFISVALGTGLGGRAFLDYPTAWMKPLVWLIESAVAISVATILAIFFVEASRSGGERS
ncbi:MAG TPA: hydrogen gas-evolving membrane-bound hydrogenase subunit E [Myxococcota bacterium]|nr:hydrogen gas-evolving membrane-bound hydrogenase subunit E [Myxococcota bacterium]